MLIPFGVFSAGVSNGGGGGGSFDLISSTILTGSQASVTLSGLGAYSSTYKHLQVRVVSKNTGANEGLVFQLNGITTASYAVHGLTGNGSSVTSAAYTSRGEMFNIGMSRSTTANAFGAGVIDILDAYSTTKNKTLRSISGYSDSINEIALYSGAFFSTASITSISFTGFANQIAAGSRFSIYGIKGA